MSKIAKKTLTLAALGLAAIILMPAFAWAQTPATLSTGVGEEERQAQTGYSVRFEFAELAGPYLADVSVTVRDSDGKTVLETVSEGPWLFVDLPPGDYRVSARTRDGSGQSAGFEVSGTKQRVVRLVWR